MYNISASITMLDLFHSLLIVFCSGSIEPTNAGMQAYVIKIHQHFVLSAKM